MGIYIVIYGVLSPIPHPSPFRYTAPRGRVMGGVSAHLNSGVPGIVLSTVIMSFEPGQSCRLINYTEIYPLRQDYND
jgi:hypothetical protein